MNVKRALIAASSTAALSLALGINPAAAANPEFTVNPNATGSPTDLGVSGLPTFQANQLNGFSNALIDQTGPSTQVETGTLELETFSNAPFQALPLAASTTGLLGEENGPGTNRYGAYFTYQVTATGLTGFGANQNGTITGGTFTFYGDVGDNNTFAAASTSATGGVAPSVTDIGGNDVVIATGNAVGGTVGTNGAGTPNFTAFADFILCNGTSGQGLLGNQLITDSRAAACGTFDATKYFIAPVPFYTLDLNSAIVPGTITVDTATTVNPGFPPNGTLNGLGANIAFINTPEPASLAMFGFGLLGLGWFARRRQKNA